MKQTKMLLAAVLAVIMLCSVLPMGAAAQETVYASIDVYDGFNPLDGIYSIEDDCDYENSLYYIGVLVESENGYSIRDEFEKSMKVYGEQQYGYALVGWRLWLNPIRPQMLADNEAEGDSACPKPIYVADLELGFTYDFGDVGCGAYILEPVFERYIMDPQPQNTDSEADGYFTAGVKYYVPGEWVGEASLDEEEEADPAEGTWADADAEDSIVDVEYQWYLYEEAEPVEITVNEGEEKYRFNCGVYENGAWCAEEDDEDYYYIDLVFEVKRGDVIEYKILDGVCNEDYGRCLVEDEDSGEYQRIGEDFNYTDNKYTAERDGMIYLCLEGDADLKAKVTVTASAVYTPAEGRTDRNLLILNGVEDMSGLESGKFYVCRAFVVKDEFIENIPLPCALSLDESETEFEEAETVYAVLESDPVEYNIVPSVEEEVPAEPAPEKKPVFSDWMKMFFYMKENFDVISTGTDGGKITVKDLVTGALSVSYKCDIVPEEGYAVKSVFVDGVDVGAVEEYTFENMADDHTIHAVFEKIAEVESEEE